MDKIQTEMKLSLYLASSNSHKAEEVIMCIIEALRKFDAEMHSVIGRDLENEKTAENGTDKTN